MRFVTGTTLALLLVATQSSAQDAPSPLGERVRVHTVQGSAVVGRLSRLDADTVVVTVVRKNEPVEVAVPRGYISLMERSLGQSPDVLRGLGAAVTVTMVSLGLSLVYDELFVPEGWESSGPNVALIAGTAIGTGVATAFLRKKDRWQAMPTPLPVAPIVGASDGRAVVGLRVGF